MLLQLVDVAKVCNSFAFAESLAFAADGSMYLLTRTGQILHASAQGEDAIPQLHSAAVALIGGGRPLGAHFDTQDNLIICHPPTVSALKMIKGN